MTTGSRSTCVEDAIPREYGISEGQLHRYDYLATYHDKNGTNIQTVQITEDRDTNSSAPDHYELGLLTAFCRVGGIHGTLEQFCPQWVIDQFA